MFEDRSQTTRTAKGLLCGALLALVIAGCSGGDPNAATSGATTGGAAGASGGGTGASGGGPGAPMMGGGGPGPGMGMSGGMGGGTGGTQTASAAAPPPKNVAPAPNFRQDPFKPWWDTTAKPPPILQVVSPIRIATTATAQREKPEGVEIQEVPNRRVAGIMTGNGAYALIDNFGGQPVVVKPGTVLEDGYVVSSINANSVVLKRVVDNRTYTQVVPLTDAGSSSSSFSGPAMGAPGGPGMRLPGAGGVPGMGRGPKGGGAGAAE